MNISRLRAVLNSAGPYTQPRMELSIFDTAGRGYYENPATDLLAFFTDPTQPHDLADCFVSGILECIPDANDFSPQLSHQPETEIVTKAGNRIDLVLRSNEWIIALEHKIHHRINNPFDDYEAHVRKNLNHPDQTPFFVLLSPSGFCSEKNWIGLRHKSFIASIRRELGRRVLEQAPNKWHILAREFLLHLENTVLEQPMNNEAFQFFIENAHSIDEMLLLRENAIEEIRRKVASRLTEVNPECNLSSRRQMWPQGPALRFALKTWKTSSDLVVYLESRDSGISVQISIYVADAYLQLEERARTEFKDLPSPTDSWREGDCFCMSWELGGFDEDKVLSFANQCMGHLSAVETERAHKRGN